MSTLVFQWSDWHLGREGDDTLSKAYSIKGKLPDLSPRACVILLGGDIFDGICVRRFGVGTAGLGDQMQAAQDVLESLIRAVAERYMMPVFVVSVAGNHERPSVVSGPSDSLSLVLANSLADADLGSSIWVRRPRFDGIEIVRIEETTGVVLHKGPPHIETSAMRAKALSLGVEFGADWIATGHLHHVCASSQGVWLLRNGSLLSRYDAFSNSLSFYETSRQQWFVVDGSEITQVGWMSFEDPVRKPLDL